MPPTSAIWPEIISKWSTPGAENCRFARQMLETLHVKPNRFHNSTVIFAGGGSVSFFFFAVDRCTGDRHPPRFGTRVSERERGPARPTGVLRRRGVVFSVRFFVRSVLLCFGIFFSRCSLAGTPCAGHSIFKRPTGFLRVRRASTGNYSRIVRVSVAKMRSRTGRSMPVRWHMIVDVFSCCKLIYDA